MPNIWDDNRIDSNLRVLKSLPAKKPGRKLDVDNDEGTLTVYEPTFLGIQAWNRKDAPSVTDVEGFQKPLRRLFKRAYETNIDHALISDALVGLRSLRSSYSGTKRVALDGLLGRLLPKGLRQFHENYGNYTRMAFAQAYFLGEGAEGICMGLTFDWVTRRVENDTWAPTLSHVLDRFESVKKLQEEYQTLANKRFAKRIEALGESLDIELVTTTPKIDGGQKLTGNKSGEQIFKTILTLLHKCRQDGPFFISYEGENPHVIGLDLRNERIEIFDPNVGAFSFPRADEAKFFEFCTGMWEKCQPNGTQYWDVVQAVS